MDRPVAVSMVDTRQDVTVWARDALTSLTGLPGVRRAGLALPEGGGRRLRFTASDRGDQAGLSWCHIDAYDDLPLNRAVRTGEPVFGSLDHLHARYADFVARQRGTETVAIAAVPLVTAGQTVGGFVLFLDRRQEFDAVQRLQLQQVGKDLGARLRGAQQTEPRLLAPTHAEPVGPEAEVAVHAVAGDPAAVSGARRFLRRTLDDWGINDDTADTAVLCLSELVTNAVIHTGASCWVRVTLEQGILTTSVRDHGSSNAATAAPLDDPLQVHGRGLQLVDALATRWGSELDKVGTTVWFVLEC